VIETAIGYALGAAAANIVGAIAVVSRKRWSVRALASVVALAAGFMLSVALLELVPEAIERGRAVHAPVWILASYLLVHLTQHTLAPHFHFGEETHHEEMLDSHVSITAVGALAIHTFFDGISIASGFVIDLKLGIVIFIAIMLHKLPEGFTVASIMLASGRGPSAARLATYIIGLATLLGVATVTFVQTLAPYTLPLSAGVTLYVAASDLIPEVNEKEGFRTAVFVFAGVALYYVTDVLLMGVYAH